MTRSRACCGDSKVHKSDEFKWAAVVMAMFGLAVLALHAHRFSPQRCHLQLASTRTCAPDNSLPLPTWLKSPVEHRNSWEFNYPLPTTARYIVQTFNCYLPQLDVHALQKLVNSYPRRRKTVVFCRHV
eukprot:442381-Amphidinium_carterae.2